MFAFETDDRSALAIDRTVCVLDVLIFRFLFAFSRFQRGIRLYFYAFCFADRRRAVQQCYVREQEMHRLTKMNLILFQGECCNMDNVFFSCAANWIPLFLCSIASANERVNDERV